jgi:CRP/FNR family transcriptional regulator
MGSAEYLRKLPVFNKLNQRQLEELADIGFERSYEVGEFIAHQEEIWPYVFILLKGAVNVQKFSAEGRALGAWWLSPEEVFWSPSIFDDGPLPASLVVRKPCKVFLLHRDNVIFQIQRQPEALLDLCNSLVQRMRKASSMVEDLAFHPLTVRVARLLIEQIDSAEDKYVTRSLTLDDMAKMIGTTPVMVCRVLSNFASEEIIKVSRTEFELLDEERLKQLVE